MGRVQIACRLCFCSFQHKHWVTTHRPSIMATRLDTSIRQTALTTQLQIFLLAHPDKAAHVTDCRGSVKVGRKQLIPNGWVTKMHLSDEDLTQLVPPFPPGVVFELVSDTDNLEKVEKKMCKYIASGGIKEAVLINPGNETFSVYSEDNTSPEEDSARYYHSTEFPDLQLDMHFIYDPTNPTYKKEYWAYIQGLSNQ
eukprot:TRINITY_DN5297_c0_g1_i2.p1 TRINITY_DN5297_c0_g1~~TRINITY_DN5297_c0_g1_i2.p1  ORF type:complete len:197 (+),score=17.03 TRINITY_DN5297_c0_g1_i2:21-611(+)